MLENFNFRIIIEYLPLFLQGLSATFLISIISIFLALATGIVACACRISPYKFLKIPAIAYIELIRSHAASGTDLFFLFRVAHFRVRIPEIQTGILALMLNSGAYVLKLSGQASHRWTTARWRRESHRA